MRLFPLVLLLACNGGAADDTDRPPRDTDGDTDPDDTDDTDDPDGPDLAKCPPWTGLRDDGRTWSWQSTAAFEAENDFSNTWTNTLALTHAADHTEATVTTAGESDIDNVDEATFTTTIRMRCDADGLWLLASDFSYTYVVFGFPDDGYVNTTWSAPELVWQRGAGVGSTWTTPSEGTTVSSEDGTSTFANTVTYTVAAQEQATVPAGTYTTVRLEAVSSANGETVTSYVDKELGAVRTDVGELVGTQP